ncbi:unnamed protein product [Gadus morhua 'NCC']
MDGPAVVRAGGDNPGGRVASVDGPAVVRAGGDNPGGRVASVDGPAVVRAGGDNPGGRVASMDGPAVVRAGGDNPAVMPQWLMSATTLRAALRRCSPPLGPHCQEHSCSTSTRASAVRPNLSFQDSGGPGPGGPWGSSPAAPDTTSTSRQPSACPARMPCTLTQASPFDPGLTPP